MKGRNTSFMAGLLILGILSASDSIAATIERSISGTGAAKISRIIDITAIEAISINDSDEIGIDYIAIRTIINPDILEDQIDAGIAQIVA